MKMTNRKVYITGLLVSISLIICTLFHLLDKPVTMAAFLAVVAVCLTYGLNTSRILKTNYKKVTVIISIFAILYVALFYTMGMYVGFYNSSYPLNSKNIINYVIPLTIIIVSTEIIRSRLLMDQSKKTKILTFFIGTIIDISIYRGIYNLAYLDNFLSFIGLISFASIANNLLYNYISSNYGAKSVIIYKLITTLYVYLFPIIPNVYPYLRTFLRMVYPLMVYTYIERYYYEDAEVVSNLENRKRLFSVVSMSLFALALIALISCKFLYGVLVIGSNSMSKSIEKGDVIFFKKTNTLQTGDVIAFYSDNMRIVHRIVDIKNINGEIRYYTKGDANPIVDEGYATNKNLIGKVLFKIKYMGIPTLWLNGKFK